MSHNVVFLLSNLKSGGTEWFALRLAQGLTLRGFHPCFLVAREEGELLEEAQKSAPVRSLSGFGYSPFGMALVLPRLVRFLRREQPEAVISGLALVNILLAVAVKFLKNKPRLIMVEHMRLCPNGLCPRTLRHRLKVRFLAFAYATADEVVSVSQTAAQDLSQYKGLSQNKTKIIYNPVIPENFQELAAQPTEHPWLKNKTTPVLLTVGRLLCVKNHLGLFRAFALARRKRPLKLIVYGEGTERPLLEDWIRHNGLENDIDLAGATANVFSAMKAADLFVLASRSEAFGNVVVEALACGLPVVCTDCGGPREILEDGRFGKLVPPDDPEALAEAVLIALETAHDREALSQKGRFFSVSRAADAYARLIRGAAPNEEKQSSE